MRAVILGTQSFIDGGTKVGSQHLAEALARQGWTVEYVPTLSSPFDIVGARRHARLKRAWRWGSPGSAISIAPGLTEWTPRAPFPAHKLFLRWRWQLGAYGYLLPRPLRTAHFDVCIADMAPNIVLMEQLRAQVNVCRLNDWPWGFASDLHPTLIRRMEGLVTSTGTDEVWAVSHALGVYAAELSPRAPVAYIPNGVDVGLLSSAADLKDNMQFRAPRSAVYVGGLTAWLDLDLLVGVARLLPDWTFDVYAPGSPPAHEWPHNLRWKGVLGRGALGAVLRGHEVGLIPFKDAGHRMRYVERPLKFYEYIAAGLGVASTDLGALQAGMGSLACYGNDAAGFATAVQQAREHAAARPKGFAEEFARENSWQTRVGLMTDRLTELLA